MTRVRAKVDDLERGDVPALCVKTGNPCANAVGVVLRPNGRRLIGRRITAVLPLDARRARFRRRVTGCSWFLLVVLALGLVLGIGAGLVQGYQIALFAFVAYVVCVGVGDLTGIGARPVEGTTDEVLLTRVHRRFARALDEQYRR